MELSSCVSTEVILSAYELLMFYIIQSTVRLPNDAPGRAGGCGKAAGGCAAMCEMRLQG